MGWMDWYETSIGRRGGNDLISPVLYAMETATNLQMKTPKNNNKLLIAAITPKKIICSGPCTIVFWQDDTKTIVRLKPGDKDDLDAAFAQAVTKKLYGSTSAAHRVVDKAIVVTNEK